LNIFAGVARMSEDALSRAVRVNRMRALMAKARLDGTHKNTVTCGGIIRSEPFRYRKGSR
jgi:hypothetical protein